MSGPRAQNENQFSLYNLSILWPLPKEKISSSPGFSENLCGHTFFTKELIAEFPQMLRVPYSIEEQYREMRLVGARFDFIKNELRLVFQPLTFMIVGRGEKAFYADDAAIHLFYTVRKEWGLSTQIKLKKKFNDLPLNKLGVHPDLDTLKNKAFVEKLLCEGTKNNLFKATFMNVRGNRVLWNFGGFKITKDSEGEYSRGDDVQIANLHGVFEDEESKMSVQRISRVSGFVRAGVLPKPQKGDHLQSFFESETERGPQDLNAIMLSVDRIENPKLNNPETVDCVSCHAADSTRRWLEREEVAASTDRYTAQNYSLDNSVSEHNMKNTGNLRAFGYLDDGAAISRRTLNDTIEMQHYLMNNQ